VNKSATITVSHPSPARRGRLGTTLVEAVIVVALIATILGCIVGFLASLQRYDVRFRQHGLRSDQLSQLAEMLRTDIRQAAAVSSNAPDANVAKMLIIDRVDGEQVRYELDAEGCRRFSGPPNITTSTELFRIGPATSWKVETGPPGRRPLYVVSLQSKSKMQSEPNATSLFVQAALGADSRSGEAP
jgi:uncharacterized membrane protein